MLVVNITFLVAGTFFNTVVVLSIWKSSQLRKKLCYFMIFILSCTDLLVVIVLHPLHIFYCIIWYFKGTLDYEHSNVFHFIGSMLIISSFTVLFTMTLERYIGITRPFFHKTFLTRRRLVSFLVVCLIVFLSVELGDFILKRQSMAYLWSDSPFFNCFAGYFDELQNVFDCKIKGRKQKSEIQTIPYLRVSRYLLSFLLLSCHYLLRTVNN